MTTTGQVPMGQITVPPVPTFKPQCPKMGGLLQVSTYDWCAWTGGKPDANWSGLGSTALTTPNVNFQYCPNSPGSSQKSASFREKGLDVKFKKGDHLLDFIDNVTQYFTRTGLDTVTYLPETR
jgi:hypothetical protein